MSPRIDRALERALQVATVLAAVAFVSQVLPPFSVIPQDDMNASQATPAVALVKDQGPYFGPDDGPVTDFLYGPMAAISFLPSALASTPSATLLIAGVINLLAFFAPMALLHATVAGLPWHVATAGFLCFAVLTSYDIALSFSAFTIHPDAPALAFCALACLACLRGGSAAAPVAATFAVLAVWTKQPTAPIVLALPLYALLTEGWRGCARLCAWIAGLGAIVSLLFVLLFDVRDMVFNMFVLPAAQPWYGEAEHGKLPALVTSIRLLAWQNRWRVAALVVLAAMDGLRERRWPLLALVGLSMAPTCMLGGAKVGAFLNAHSFTSYFLLGAVTLGLAEAAVWGERRRLAAVVLVVLVSLPAVAWLADARHRTEVAEALVRLRAWSANPQQQAYDFARNHPGQVYFPWNPLAALQADGRLDHSEIGIWNRELVWELDDTFLRRYLPPDLRYVAFRPPRGALTRLEPGNHHLPEFSKPVTVEGLEGWNVYARADDPRP